jgi:hypothetical protein
VGLNEVEGDNKVLLEVGASSLLMKCQKVMVEPAQF